MRKLMLGCVLGAMALTAYGQDETKKKEKAPVKAAPKKAAVVSLKVGDKAPALNATNWLQGNEVKFLEKGQIYVVEFWKGQGISPGNRQGLSNLRRPCQLGQGP